MTRSTTAPREIGSPDGRRGHIATALLAALALAGCLPNGRESAAEAWVDARARWVERRDPFAWRAWMDIDPASPEGREARELLAEADALYRNGIARIDRDEPDARAQFDRAVRLAPMDPRLYLPLARAFRGAAERSLENPRLFIRAAAYYRKFLLLVPEHPERAAALVELEELDPETEWLDAPEVAVAPIEPSTSSIVPTSPSILAATSMALAIVALGLLLYRSGRSLRSLEALAEERPELHPAIAYLVASLRHELLKHRIGAVASAIEDLASGRASIPQREFVHGRLFGGEPLGDAWEGHLRAFERALGPELDLRRTDRDFMRAGRSIALIGRLEDRLRRNDPRAIVRLRAAHEELRTLDRRLGALMRRLVRTRVDAALVHEVVDEVRREYTASRVELDAIAVEAPEPGPSIEVFRVDLVLVLKNVVRNAILAAGRSERPRRVQIEVRTELELTGEENVVIRVRDTSPETLTTEAIYERKMGSGLGLVTGALSRYDGAISVESGEAGWAKSVVLRFFRAFDDADPELRTSASAEQAA